MKWHRVELGAESETETGSMTFRIDAVLAMSEPRMLPDTPVGTEFWEFQILLCDGSRQGVVFRSADRAEREYRALLVALGAEGSLH